jgi:hypothetical protein
MMPPTPRSMQFLALCVRESGKFIRDIVVCADDRDTKR